MFFVTRTQMHAPEGRLVRARKYMSTVHIEQNGGIQPYLIINLEVCNSGGQTVDQLTIISMNPGELDFFLLDTWNASVNIASIQYAYHDPEISKGYMIQDVEKILSFTPNLKSWVGNDESITESQHRYYLTDGSVHCTAPEAEKAHGGRLLWGDDEGENFD